MGLDDEMNELDLFKDDEEEKNTDVEVKEKKDKKINRSYMIGIETLSKLQELKINNPDKTYSDIVEMAINNLYKNTNK